MCIICYGNIKQKEYVEILNCSSIKYIPKLLAISIKIENCPNIIELPNLDKLKYLKLVKCINLQKIPLLHNLQELEINNCPSIINLPLFPKLLHLNMKYFFKFNTISNFNLLETLVLESCNISNIDKLPSLNSLILYKLSSLEYIFDSNKLKIFVIQDCHSLVEIPKFTNLVELTISNCKSIKFIPYFKYLSNLVIDNFHYDLFIPTFTNLKILVIYNCMHKSYVPILKNKLEFCDNIEYEDSEVFLLNYNNEDFIFKDVKIISKINILKKKFIDNRLKKLYKNYNYFPEHLPVDIIKNIILFRSLKL